MKAILFFKDAPKVEIPDVRAWDIREYEGWLVIRCNNGDVALVSRDNVYSVKVEN